MYRLEHAKADNEEDGDLVELLEDPAVHLRSATE